MHTHRAVCLQCLYFSRPAHPLNILRSKIFRIFKNSRPAFYFLSRRCRCILFVSMEHCELDRKISQGGAFCMLWRYAQTCSFFGKPIQETVAASSAYDG